MQTGTVVGTGLWSDYLKFGVAYADANGKIQVLNSSLDASAAAVGFGSELNAWLFSIKNVQLAGGFRLNYKNLFDEQGENVNGLVGIHCLKLLPFLENNDDFSAVTINAVGVIMDTSLIFGDAGRVIPVPLANLETSQTILGVTYSLNSFTGLTVKYKDGEFEEKFNFGLPKLLSDLTEFIFGPDDAELKTISPITHVMSGKTGVNEKVAEFYDKNMQIKNLCEEVMQKNELMPKCQKIIECMHLQSTLTEYILENYKDEINAINRRFALYNQYTQIYLRTLVGD